MLVRVATSGGVQLAGIVWPRGLRPGLSQKQKLWRRTSLSREGLLAGLRNVLANHKTTTERECRLQPSLCRASTANC